MKELSIEGNGNYKAYYTELINRLEAVKDAIKKLNYGIAMDIMCKPYHEFQVTTHSELKESGDENIRKELISLFEDDAKGIKIRYTGEDCERWIAWLEKQGEKIELKFREGDTMRTKQEAADGIKNGLPVVVSIDSKYYHCNNELIPIKDQDNYEYPPMNRKQKPVDKVEPKFKVGDWVVNTITGNVEQIIEVTNNEYICSGTLIVSFDNQHLLKKWTIQDAKDGDILCTYECGKPKIVFMLKGAPKKPYVLGYHCYYNIIYPHFEFDSEKGCLAPNDEDVNPATKEQCDILFQKMKEAGYEWDVEKKELKKIEPKTAAWTPMDEQRVENLLAIIEGHGYPGEVAWLNSLKDRVQSKQEWSEEDEKMYASIIDDTVQENQLDGKQIDWLRNIKYRNFARPQNTWKPSDEQIKVCKEVYADILSAKGFDLGTVNSELNRLEEQLKNKE